MLKSSIVLYMMLFNYYIHCRIETKKESKVIEKLPTIARVLSAISLHNGLANGVIPMEPVVSELLNLGGSHKLSTFDKGKVEKFLMELENLKFNNNSTEIEQSLMLFYEIKSEWSGMEMSKHLAVIKDYGHWQPIIESWKILDEIDVDEVIVPLMAEKSFTAPSIAFRSVISNIRLINKTEVQELLAIAENFRSFRNTVRLLIMTQNTMNNMNQTDILNSIHEDFTALEGVTSSPPEAELALIYSIVASQVIHYSNSTNRAYTAGFDDGFKSLKNLDADFSDEFVAKLINSSVSFHNADLAFLEKPIEQLYTTWREFGTLSNFMAIHGLMSVYQLLNGAKGALNAVNETIQSIQKCDVPMSKDNHFDKLSSVICEGIILERKLIALLSLIELVEGSQAGFEEDLMAKNILSDLKTNILIVQSSVTFGNITHIFDLLLMEKLKTMTENFKNHTEYLNCLKNTVPYLDKVGKASKFALKFRKIKNPSVNVDSPIIFATLQDIQFISTKIDTKIIENISKSKNIKKSVELVNLKNLQSLAKVFGESVHALMAAEKLITSGSLDILLAFSAKLHKFVKDEVKLKSPPELQLLLIDWEIMLSSFVKFCLSVNKWKKSYNDFLKARSNKELHLVDLGPIFTDLANIDEIDFDISTQLVAFERLRRSTNSSYSDHDACMEALRNISRLDLSLSKYRNSLNEMSNTLKEFKEILEKSASKKTGWSSYILWGSIGLGCLLLLGLIIFFIVCCIKRRKQSKNEGKNMKKSKSKFWKVSVTSAPTVPKLSPQLPESRDNQKSKSKK